MNNQPDSISNAPIQNGHTVTPLFERKGFDMIAALVLIVLSICGVSAVFWNGLGLGYTLVFFVTTVFISAAVIKKNVKFSLSFWLCGILSLICAASFFVSSNTAVKVFTLLATSLSAMVFFTNISGKEYTPGDYYLAVYFFNTVIKAAGSIPAIFKSFIVKREGKSKTASHILIGAAAALPAVLIIVPLLANADEAFYTLVTKVFTGFYTLVQKVIIGVFLSVILLAVTFYLKYSKDAYGSKELKVSVNNASACTFLCVLCFVYLVYLFSQLAYFFSAFSSMLPKGYKFTYAQYARRGFFELCAISVINLIVIFIAILFSKKKNGKITLAVKLPSAFIVLFTFIIIFTAISKMVMYIGAYGCTILRVCTSAFMIWIFAVFVCVLIRLFKKRFDILKAGLIFALIILAVLGLGNVNARIAEYNYSAYKSGKLEIDVKYMGELGYEGIPYLYELTKDEDTEKSDIAKEELSKAYVRYYRIMWSDLKEIDSYKAFLKYKNAQENIGSYSIPKSKAYEILDKYAKEQDGVVYYGSQDKETYLFPTDYYTWY
ncbi:MAG: DUF4173 domain-containing protein [Clostridia bacterium]|nr:DUF4173 domain-containing protein [Clostridia bacterium]